MRKIKIKTTSGFKPVKKRLKKLDLKKYKKKISCLLEKGDKVLSVREEVLSFERTEKRKMKRCCLCVRKTEKRGRLRRS